MTNLNPWQHFGTANELIPGSEQGVVIYVNSAANGALDANHGRTPEEAKLTISGALDACSNNAQDTIVVLNHDNATEIAYPIVVDVEGVHILGAPGRAQYARVSINARPSGDVAVFTLDVTGIRISNFELYCGDTHGSIEFVVAWVGDHGIYNCKFNQGGYGVYATSQGMPGWDLIVKDCMFNDNLLLGGIEYLSDGPFARFENNIFNRHGGICIDIAGTAAVEGAILNNWFGLSTDVANRAIHFSAAAHTGWIISGNQANYGMTDMTNSPYQDQSNGVNPNNWMLNYRAVTAVLPT